VVVFAPEAAGAFVEGACAAGVCDAGVCGAGVCGAGVCDAGVCGAGVCAKATEPAKRPTTRAASAPGWRESSRSCITVLLTCRQGARTYPARVALVDLGDKILHRAAGLPILVALAYFGERFPARSLYEPLQSRANLGRTLRVGLGAIVEHCLSHP